MAIYLVEGPGGSKSLVETRKAKGAINHAAHKLFKATPLDGSEIVKAVTVDKLVLEKVDEKPKAEKPVADKPQAPAQGGIGPKA